MISGFRRHVTDNRGIAAILVLYLVLATLYNFANPLFEPPDEIHHYNFIRYLQQTHRLPVVDLDGPETEYHQAPLYYTIAALLTAPLPHESSIAPYAMRNPFWAYEIGQVGRDNKNQYLHDADQRFPSPDAAVWTMHLTRALSTVFGCGTLLLTYFLARCFVSRPMAVGAMAVLAFMPNFLFTSSAMTNDGLTILVSTAVILHIVTTATIDAPPSPRRWLGLGVLLGLALLTKVSAWPLLAVAALMVVLLAIRLKSWRLFFTASVILTATVGLIGGWWIVRNMVHYGDLTGLASDWATWGMRKPPTPDTYLSELVSFRRSFWVTFGYGNIPLPEWGYIPIDLFVYGGSGGLILAVARFRRVPPVVVRRHQLILLGVWVILAGITLLWFWYRATATNGRHVYAILPVVILAIIGGWHILVPERRHRRLAALFGGLMALLAVLAWAFILIPAYRPSPRLTPDQLLEAATNRLDWQIGDVAILRGYRLSQPSVRPGDTVIVTLFWEALSSTERSYSAYVHLVGPDGETVGRRDTYPGLGNDPTVYWQPGEIIEDAIPVPIGEDAEGPILVNIVAGLYDRTIDEPLDTRDQNGSIIEYPVIGRIKLEQTKGVALNPQYPLDVTFQNGLRLDGYDLSTTGIQPATTLTLTLYWLPGGPLPVDYTTFVQLVDEQNNIMAQGDGPPLGGWYPTSFWGANEHFKDSYSVDIPGDVPTGTYHVLVGLYSLQNMARLSLENGADSVRLDQDIRLR